MTSKVFFLFQYIQFWNEIINTCSVFSAHFKYGCDFITSPVKDVWKGNTSKVIPCMQSWVDYFKREVCY